MLTWTLIFLVVSLIAGALGFGRVSSTSAGIARVMFSIFLVCLVVSVVLGLMHGFNWGWRY